MSDDESAVGIVGFDARSETVKIFVDSPAPASGFGYALSLNAPSGAFDVPNVMPPILSHSQRGNVNFFHAVAETWQKISAETR